VSRERGQRLLVREIRRGRRFVPADSGTTRLSRKDYDASRAGERVGVEADVVTPRGADSDGALAEDAPMTVERTSVRSLRGASSTASSSIVSADFVVRRAIRAAMEAVALFTRSATK